MTIHEICEVLRGELLDPRYEYGFICGGQVYRPDRSAGFDREFDRLLKTISCVQDPAATKENRVGTCVDAVMLMRKTLEQYRISSTIWLLYAPKGNKAHTVLTFEAENQVVYLELTPQSAKPWYGCEIVYSSVQAFQKEFEKQGYEVTDVTDEVIVGERPYFLLNKLR